MIRKTLLALQFIPVERWKLLFEDFLLSPWYDMVAAWVLQDKMTNTIQTFSDLFSQQNMLAHIIIASCIL